MDLFKFCAISERRATEGLLFPVSILWSVKGLIPTFFANCCRVNPFFFRSILILVPIFSISPKSFVEDIYQTINILSSIFLKNDNFFKKNDILLNSSLTVRKNGFNEIENLRDRKSAMTQCHAICRDRGNILIIVGRLKHGATT